MCFECWCHTRRRLTAQRIHQTHTHRKQFDAPFERNPFLFVSFFQSPTHIQYFINCRHVYSSAFRRERIAMWTNKWCMRKNKMPTFPSIPENVLIKIQFTHLAIEQSSIDIRLVFRRHNPVIDSQWSQPSMVHDLHHRRRWHTIWVAAAPMARQHIRSAVVFQIALVEHCKNILVVFRRLVWGLRTCALDWMVQELDMISGRSCPSEPVKMKFAIALETWIGALATLEVANRAILVVDNLLAARVCHAFPTMRRTSVTLALIGRTQHRMPDFLVDQTCDCSCDLYGYWQYWMPSVGLADPR